MFRMYSFALPPVVSCFAMIEALANERLIDFCGDVNNFCVTVHWTGSNWCTKFDILIIPSQMERRDTNLRHSSLVTLGLWIQSRLRSQVKQVRLSQYSLYGCLLLSDTTLSSMCLGQMEAEVLKQNKCFIFSISS